LIALCADEGSLQKICPEFVMATTTVEKVKQLVVENCTKHGHLEIPELRDALGTTRKYLIPLLEYFDSKGVTTRLGANRVLKKR
jgi:selenocysteine-specific elongation factor